MSAINWQRSIEQVVLTSLRDRVLGFTSARRGAGVSLVSRLVAQTMAHSGGKTLLVDMSEPRTAVGADSRVLTSTALRGCIIPSVHGFDLLSGTDGEAARAFAKLPWLRQVFDSDFSDYQHIVLDLPPILESSFGSFNTVAAAGICNRLLLVCAVGKDRRSEVTEVASLLHTSGVPLTGVVSNEHDFVDRRREAVQKGAERGRH